MPSDAAPRLVDAPPVEELKASENQLQSQVQSQLVQEIRGMEGGREEGEGKEKAELSWEVESADMLTVIEIIGVYRLPECQCTLGFSCRRVGSAWMVI